MIKLTNRLLAVAGLVPKCNLVADIGTDHAYIPIYLIQRGIAKRAIASDVAVGPAMIAKSNIDKHGLSQNIDVVVCSGVEKIEGADVIVIAGMGGRLICDIISACAEAVRKAGTIILQPMTAQYEVRKYLHANNFKIINELLAKEEQKLYNIIVAQIGSEEYSEDIHYYVGKRLIENGDALFGEYISKKVGSIDVMLNSLSKSEGENAKIRYSQLEKFKQELLKL